ncbi:hypothetical protein E3N88_04916 [Mikania micrantha]|uniref:Uncharacterized protein n=1 Tax=Mikania micrantha TaxID=192012 RepID=A0A5N6PXY0_9ASTR|nr:hypothetical protein E3N88_04916 [Mikania micrantha]
MLTGGHNECNFDGNAGSAMTCGGKREQSSFESFYMTMSCDPGHVTPMWTDTTSGNLGKRPRSMAMDEERLLELFCALGRSLEAE